MGGVWCFRLYSVDSSITGILYVHNITSACRGRDYAEDRCYTHIHTFQIKVLPEILNYVTSPFKSRDARVHEAVEDPPKRSLVTVRSIVNFYE